MKSTLADRMIPICSFRPSPFTRPSFGRVPRLVATDAGFYSARNEAAAKAMGVKRVCIPNRSSRSRERKREQKKRWFRNGQKGHAECEARISVVTCRNGLNRCRYKDDD